MDRDFLNKIATEDELIRAFEGKVLDKVLQASTAENKPEDDVAPTATIPAASDIEAIVASKSGLPDLTPSGKRPREDASDSSVTSENLPAPKDV